MGQGTRRSGGKRLGENGAGEIHTENGPVNAIGTSSGEPILLRSNTNYLCSSYSICKTKIHHDKNRTLFGFQLRLSYSLYSEHRASMPPILQWVSPAFIIHTVIIHALVIGAPKLCRCKVVFVSPFSRSRLLIARTTEMASHHPPLLTPDHSSLVDTVVSTAASAPLLKRARSLVLLAPALADSWMS